MRHNRHKAIPHSDKEKYDAEALNYRRRRKNVFIKIDGKRQGTPHRSV